MLGLWRVLMVTGIAVGAVVVGLLAWTVVRHRRPRDPGAELPPQTRENIPLEIAYTAVPLVIVAVLFAISMDVQRPVTRVSDSPGLRVEATAFQWGWRFAYPGHDVTVLGDSNTPPTLVVPLAATTRLELESPDVIHSFAVPSFLQKHDVIPGTVEEIDVTPTRVGRYAGYCAEFCGLDHARMTFEVEVMTQPDFDRWLADRRQEQDDGGDDSDRGPDGASDASGQARVAVPPAPRVEVR